MSAPAKFLEAQWRFLVMLNYEVEPSLVGRLVPKGTELDSWNGRTFVSLVGFRFLETKVLGLRIPFHTRFDEVNLRFYVRRREGDEWRRGVVFVKELVPRAAIALIARWAYNEPYRAVPMRSVVDPPSAANGQRGSLTYAWKWADRWNELAATVEGDPRPLVPGSEEEFITEHYWGYTAQRDGSTFEYRVEHPSWRVWRATGSRFAGNVASLYGPDFAAMLARPPGSAFVAEGSEIVVRRPTRLGR
jgi:uncharacterized protein